jgi:hypothetical protein
MDSSSNAYSVSPSLWNQLQQMLQDDPFRGITFLIFMGAILHTFLAGKFAAKSKQITTVCGHETYTSRLLHWLGEVEAIFGIWLIPLVICFIGFKGWDDTVAYFSTRQYQEPIFVFAIMTIAATKPILCLAEICIRKIVRCLGKECPSTWWVCILMFAPLLGSLITEPAAMTIAAMLLANKVFVHNPGKAFSYATIGLLFVNVSVGGVLTNFAAPPILMVATKWNWSSAYVFSHFGIKSVIGIVLASLFYFVLFSKQLRQLNTNAKNSDVVSENKDNVPLWVIAIHTLFLIWVVFNSHHTVFVVWGFLAFLCIAHILKEYQSHIAIKESLLVGCFLAGLVTHGGLQEWWIEAVLSRLGDLTLFLGSVILTAFNDNASLTYLASLVPEFMDNFCLQSAVVSGAIVGGGLTVIANAPNPAGQALLSKYFPNGIVKPLPLLLGALFPTILFMFIFRCVNC